MRELADGEVYAGAVAHRRSLVYARDDKAEGGPPYTGSLSEGQKNSRSLEFAQGRLSTGSSGRIPAARSGVASRVTFR